MVVHGAAPWQSLFLRPSALRSGLWISKKVQSVNKLRILMDTFPYFQLKLRLFETVF